MKKKRCPQCEKTKAINEFSKDSSKPDGYKGLCKNCKNKRARERARERRADPEYRAKINKRKRELYQEQQKSELFENIMKVGKIVNEIFC